MHKFSHATCLTACPPGRVLLAKARGDAHAVKRRNLCMGAYITGGERLAVHLLIERSLVVLPLAIELRVQLRSRATVRWDLSYAC